jgi:hypothetical protein
MEVFLLVVATESGREKKERGVAAHCENIADISGDDTIADAFKATPFLAEVDAFYHQVGGEDKELAGMDAEDGGIIAGSQPRLRRLREARAKPANDFAFFQDAAFTPPFSRKSAVK